ncbi:MAG TPA: hypothetical protein VGN36_00325 [Sphingorhabdus sp.]|nr:hypothetical protein [Sphingorhabdus sp.]
MSKVSRRNFVALGGATVALGACKATGSPAKNDMVGKGPSPHNGHFAHMDKPAGSTLPPFEPRYITAIYLKFGAKGNKHAMIARHGYAELPDDPANPGKPTKDQGVIQALAEQELAEAQNPKGPWKRPNDKPNKKWRREDDLEKLDFDSQNILFILLDNDADEYRFDDRIEKGTGDATTGTRANLVRFTHYAGQPYANEIEYSVVEPNNAFVNARLIDALATGPFKGRRILRLENWFVDKDGMPIKPWAKLLYSMNLHLLATTAGGKIIPLIIDPDTGNGMGNNP